MTKLKFIIYTSFILLLSACGENRSGEYLSRTEEDTWIEEKMKDMYLWYYDMPEASTLNYFAVPKDFFPTVLSKVAQENTGDKFSYIEVDNNETTATRYIDQESSYGFDFTLYNDPFGKTSNRYARVIFVLPDSPASEAGLKRGDWISGVNNETLTESNYGYLYQGEQCRFATAQVGMKSDSTYYWINTDTLTLSASRHIEDNPFYVDSIYQVSGKRIAYLMYNRFVAGNALNETAYNQQMIQTFSRFQSSGANELILDFRYNQGGALECSQLMASLIAPASALGKTYCSLQYNDKHLADNYALSLSSELANGINLNMNRVYIIVSSLTAFAPEALIYCLTPYMKEENIIVIGTKTAGQNVATQAIPSPYNFTLYPVVATVLNSEGNSKYYRGISPTYTLDETTYYDRLHALGNREERMLYNTLMLITTGSIPDIKQNTTETRRLSPSFNSMNQKRIPGTIK